MIAALRGTETGLQGGGPKSKTLIAGDGRLHPGGEVKRAACPLFALHPDTSIHHLDQTAGDCQTQASAPKSSGVGAVHLRKSLEDKSLFFRRDADAGILHREVQGLRAVRRTFNHHGNLTMTGELDRISDE